jgi:hypothetical protein
MEADWCLLGRTNMSALSFSTAAVLDVVAVYIATHAAILEIWF